MGRGRESSNATKSPSRLSTNLSAEISQARRELNNIFKVLKEKCSQKSSIWQSYSLDMKGEIDFLIQTKAERVTAEYFVQEML